MNSGHHTTQEREWLEGIETPCEGSSDCQARRHIHGCYADYGDCTEPDEHDPSEIVPVGLEHDE